MLLEFASKLVEDVIPKPTLEEDRQAFKEAQQTLWQVGLTGVHDYDGMKSYPALDSLHAEGRLKLRVTKNLKVDHLDEILEKGWQTGDGDDMLRIGGIKAFADGALGPHTAAMLQPYEGEPDNRGMLFYEDEELMETVQRVVKGGLSLTFHAIGDRANHQLIEMYAQLRDFESDEGLPLRRHRIEHVQVIHPRDIPRLAKFGIIASMQPIHATADMLTADVSWGERSRYAYAWRDLLDNGTVLAFGSDAPVDTHNPFCGIHAAVTRRRADGSPGPEGWRPEQKITVLEALHGYTIGPAYAAGMEDRLGKIAPNFLADLILINTDPFACEPDALKDIKTTATMVSGEWVWKV
jgi:predicted amidohydrolase YtcJ